MNILYYSWNETQAADCIACMKDLGHNVALFTKSMTSYTHDEETEKDLLSFISSHLSQGIALDCLYSFNYFPVLSRVCQAIGLPYISWVYDSPHYTLESKTLGNPCNHVYIFDYALYEKYVREGYTTVAYMPLGFYQKRISTLVNNIHADNTEFIHDVSFIGNLYNDQYNFLDQIENLPEYFRGYIDAIIESQLCLQGADIIDVLFDHNRCDELAGYATLGMGDDYNDCRDFMFRNMIRRKATAIERPRILKTIGEKHKLALYSGANPPEDINVQFMGYAESLLQMPSVFNRSKINLNITLRTIQTGIPLRIIDILGAGGFCLTNYQAELSEYFENGVDLVWYESPEDMLAKIDYYLDPAHEDERLRIAENGCKKATELFSYERLLPEVLRPD